jgi:hypothetical protein
LEYLESLSEEERNVHDNFHKTGGGHAQKFWIVDTECDLVQLSKLVDQEMSILEVLDLPDDFPLGVDDASKDGATVLLQLRDVNGQSVQHEDEDSVRQGDRTASAYAGVISDRQALTCEDPSFVSTSKDFSGCTDSSLRVIPLVAISVVFFLQFCIAASLFFQATAASLTHGSRWSVFLWRLSLV